MALSTRKSGTSLRLAPHGGRTRREEQLLENILKAKALGLAVLKMGGVPNHPLLVYGNLPFPILFDDYLAEKKRRVPRWDELSQWMRMQIVILAFQEWNERFLTFNIHLNKKKGVELVSNGYSPRKVIRDRIRKHLDKTLNRRAAYFFVIEGWNKATRSPANLHIHGAVWLADPAEGEVVIRAIEKGMAQGVRGYVKEPRATVSKLYHGGGANYGNYITKLTHWPDPRLDRNRITFSNEATSVGKAMWAIITGRFGTVPLRRLTREQGIDLE